MGKGRFLQFVFVACLLITVFFAQSQTSAPQSLPALVPNTPIDGGIFLLMAAGIIYGAKALYRQD